jgi:selenocysteine lyase/cysteine desulfurase
MVELLVLQVIKTALTIQLKEQMGIDNIMKREHEIVYIFSELGAVSIKILAGQHQDRLGVISFYVDDLHFNLGVKLLNDKFGIQTRGGCSCAWYLWTLLLHVDQETSHKLIDEITLGDLISRVGSECPFILQQQEIEFVCTSIKALAENHKTFWIIPIVEILMSLSTKRHNH